MARVGLSTPRRTGGQTSGERGSGRHGRACAKPQVRRTRDPSSPNGAPALFPAIVPVGHEAPTLPEDAEGADRLPFGEFSVALRNGLGRRRACRRARLLGGKPSWKCKRPQASLAESLPKRSVACAQGRRERHARPCARAPLTVSRCAGRSAGRRFFAFGAAFSERPVACAVALAMPCERRGDARRFRFAIPLVDPTAEPVRRREAFPRAAPTRKLHAAATPCLSFPLGFEKRMRHSAAIAGPGRVSLGR